jgi:hypothetical protein
MGGIGPGACAPGFASPPPLTGPKTLEPPVSFTPSHSVAVHFPRLAAVLLVSALLPSTGRAALTLRLKSLVEFSPLIVKCRFERDDRGLRYRVLETWKGTYSPDLFAVSPSDGYFRPNHWPVRNPTEGQEIILFFTANPYGSMLRGGAASFPVTDGMIVYDSSDIFGGTRYTVAGFKREVLSYVHSDARGAVFGGAAAWWLRVSAVSEGQSLFAERFRNALPPSPPDQPLEARTAGEPETGDVNRTVVIILAVAASVLIFWLVYRSLHRRTLGRA